MPAGSGRARASGLVMAALLLVSPARAQGLGVLPEVAHAPREDGKDPGWTVLLEPYLFASGLEGDVASGDGVGDVDADFGDLLDHLDFGGMVRVEIVPPASRWSFLVDLMYVELGDDGTAPGPGAADVELDVDQFIGELSAAYRLREDGRLDLLGGLRYWDLSTKLVADLPGGPRAARASADWIDPLVGVRSTLPLGERVDLTLRGDLGGFGVGSDVSLQLGAAVSWSVSRAFSLVAGYRYLDVDYDDDLTYDVAQSGPVLGCVIQI